MKIEKITSHDSLRELKNEYMKLTTSALDGMWLTGFVPQANHYGLFENDKLIGYFCINHDGYLLQFLLSPESKLDRSELFKEVLKYSFSNGDCISGAFCSTAEPQYFSICLDNFNSHKVNTIMYEDYENDISKTPIELELLQENMLDDAVAFAHQSIGAPTDWLKIYYSNLVKREELYAYFKSREIVAIGECRRFDEFQTSYVDLGVIVSKRERNQGLATKMLLGLKNIAKENGLKPICSTTIENIPAQKAISKAGFLGTNRIVQFVNRES